MFKVIRKILALSALLLLAVVFAMPAAAMDFSVRAVLPENQRNNGNTFFDLLVEPGQMQELVVEVRNSSSSEIVVLVETITATTSRSGQINYTSRGTPDETMKYSFEDMVDLRENYFTIPGNSSIQVPIGITVPDEPFDGAILGSIRVLREATQEEKDAAGAIVNQYAHVTAVRLVQDENAEDIPAGFALGAIDAELINYRASIVAEIRNTQPRIIKGASATASIYPMGSSEAIFNHGLETLDFAPNSVFPYSFVDREGYGIEAGDYTAVINIEYGGENWRFEQNFTIVPEVAAAVNNGAVNQTGQQRPAAANETGVFGAPMWLVVAIGVGAAMLTAVIILIILVARRRPAYNQNALRGLPRQQRQPRQPAFPQGTLPEIPIPKRPASRSRL